VYLVDTNVWLEALLDQERSQDVRLFLTAVPSSDLHITDFAFHSIGLVLSRLHRPDTFLRFVEDLFVDGSTTLIHLTPEEMRPLVAAMERFSLDFDDAYQYLAAQTHQLTMVSFDMDFDRTDLGRKAPAEALL